MCDIIDRLEDEIVPGSVIPKPETDRAYLVKGWGTRRGRASSGLSHSESLEEVEAPPEGRHANGVEACIRAT